MDISPNFVPWLQTEVSTYADKYQVAGHRAFPAWAFGFIFGLDDGEAFNQTETLSQGDAGLDGWFLDTENSVLHLAQAKYHANPASHLETPDGLRALIHAALLLQGQTAIEEGAHREKLMAAAVDMQKALEDDFAISLDFLVAGRVSEQTRKELSEAIAQLGPKVTAAFYDIERLHELWLADEPIGDLANVTVKFELSGHSEFYTKSNVSTPGVVESAIASLDGKSIGAAVMKHGARLFHANIRYFLTRSNKVNKAMLETLGTPEGRDAFWLYNNGLTIVANSYTVEDDGAGGQVVCAVNPQIVNGAQTSTVLHERYATIDKGQVAVQARIIAIDDSAEGKSALLNISKFTNSQSPVRASDLRSNDKRHLTIQQSFKTLSPKVFYERRRGEWQSLDAGTRAQFAGRRVTKEDVGQRYLAFVGRPAVAVGNKDSIFDPSENETLAFSTSTPASLYMLAHELFQAADDLLVPKGFYALRKLVPSFSVDDNESEGLVTLRRSRKLAAAHATALAHEVLKWRYSAVADSRATALRETLVINEAANDFIWRHVFRAISAWTTFSENQSQVRSDLQKPETLAKIVGILKDQLADASKDALPPL